jgi:Flp pilus assembly protein TadG
MTARKHAMTHSSPHADRSLGCRGTVALEFALLLPVLVLLLVGVTDYGMAVYLRTSLESAARVALQYAIRNPADTTGITNAAVQAAKLDTAGITVVPSQLCGCPETPTVTAACPVTCAGSKDRGFSSVTVTATFTPILPYPGIPSTIPMSGTAIMRTR